MKAQEVLGRKDVDTVEVASMDEVMEAVDIWEAEEGVVAEGIIIGEVDDITGTIDITRWQTGDRVPVHTMMMNGLICHMIRGKGFMT
jgi:hypothetical protein